jgi:3-phytase
MRESRRLSGPLAGLVCLLPMVLAACGTSRAPSSPHSTSAGAGLIPAAETESVSTDADDPAIWIHPTDPGRSLIVGTDKVASTGGLYVFGLDGRVRQVVSPLDRPNNVDVEYGLLLAGAPTDIVVTTERRQRRLRVYRIGDANPPLEEISEGAGLPVLEGAAAEAGEPMGIALYKRPRDGAVFAIVAPKTGGETDYLWQYRLEENGQGRVGARFVRRFGAFSRAGSGPGEIGEIEAVVVDDPLGYVYYSDERFGIRKYHADPDHPDAARELTAFGREGYQGDREGLAIYARSNGTGFIVSVDQIDGGSVLRLFRREGTRGDPHDHRDVIHTVVTTADATDGLEVTATALPGFPEGLSVLMNSRGRNFHLYSWQQLRIPR